MFARASFIFYGSTKKVAYEAQLAGEKLIPIQAITCVLYTLGALIGSYLFLIGLFTPALLFTIALTQLWRILSETMRADFRGFGNISAYQKMGMMSVYVYLWCQLFRPCRPLCRPRDLRRHRRVMESFRYSRPATPLADFLFHLWSQYRYDLNNLL